ncbi:MAG: VCBS repeat-containing protein, partial [Candidatus Zixiibacteriota bacterium]
MLARTSFCRACGSVGLLLAFMMPPAGHAESLSPSGDGLDFEIIRTHYGDVMTIYAADFDHDNCGDVVYTGIIAEGLYILYGKSDGSFEAPVDLMPGDKVYEAPLAAGFVNTDTLLDIVVSTNHYVYVLLNSGNRNFSKRKLFKGNLNMGGVAVGLFDSDQYMDILAAPRYIHLGNGQGYFPSIITLPFDFLTAFVTDFNNDGIDDFVTTIDGSGNGAIYVNDGNANFTKTDSFVLGGLALPVSTDETFADFNRDGNADFAFVAPVQPSTLSKISIGYGDGAGGLIKIDTLNVYGACHSLAITDVNRDHNLDIAASNAFRRRLEVFLGDGAGNFSDSLRVDFGTDSITHAMATGDLDRDGNPDFVAGAFWGDSIILAMNTLEDKDILQDPMVTTGYSNVTIEIQNPDGYQISKNYKTVAGGSYWRLDANADNAIDERAIDYNLQNGEYRIVIRTKLNAPPDATFSTDVKIGDTRLTLFKDYPAPPLTAKPTGGFESGSFVFYYTVEPVSSVFPPNGSTSETACPTFDWTGLVSDPPAGTKYHFQLSRYYDFHFPVCEYNGLNVPEYTSPYELGHDAVFYWRFRTYYGGEYGEFSHPFAVYIS